MAYNVDVQKLNQENMDRAMRMFGDWTRNWQAIAAELTDYGKRSMEQNARMFERLMTARSIEQAMEIQSDHAKLAYDNYMQEMTKLGSMYASFAREAYKPAGSSQASS